MLLAAAVLGAMSGCGLIDQLSDLKNIKFDLPKQMYSLSTMDPRWKNPPEGGIPEVPCGPGGLIMDCCMPPAPAGPIECTRYPLVCEQMRCALKFRFDQIQTIELSKQVPALQTGGQIFSKVTLTQLDLGITNNLNVGTPPVNLYVGPADAMNAEHPGAKRIATISAKPAGWKGQELLPVEPDAQAAFSGYARDVQTPFNLIISTVVTVPSGSQTPRGNLDVVVGGKVEAGL